VNRKLPPDAFDAYIAMGLARSYAAVAMRYGVSKVTVTKRATKEGWQKRVQEIEAKARVASDEKAAGDDGSDQHPPSALRARDPVEGARSPEVDVSRDGRWTR
jgi:hypothetical protein